MAEVTGMTPARIKKEITKNINDATSVFRSEAAAATIVANTAKGVSENTADRVAALESREGLSPESPVDGQTANLILQRETLTSRATIELAETHGGMINIVDYGATLGAADNSAAFRNAANAAAVIGGTLYIPTGDWRIEGRVTVKSHIRCDGRVLMRGGSQAGFEIIRGVESVGLDSSLMDLTEGTTEVGGLPANMVGSIYVQNLNEIHIKRWGGDGSEYAGYYKSEVSSVILPGLLGQPLVNSYIDKADTTVTFYPAEKPLLIESLNIIVDGTGSATGGGRFVIRRSDVTVNDLVVRNITEVDQQQPVVVQWSTNVEFNRPSISDFYHSNGGYGIMGSSTADMRIYNGSISRCRHAVSGQKNKNLLIDGGYYESGFDDHWTHGIEVKNLTSSISSGRFTLTHLVIAGKGDVSIRNVNLIGGDTIMSIRSDSPELDGRVVVEDVVWETSPDTDFFRGLRYYTTAGMSYEWGKPYLATPELVRFNRCTFKVPSAGKITVVQSAGAGFKHREWGRIEVADISAPTAARVLAVYHEGNPALLHPDDPGVRITVERIQFPVGSFGTIQSLWIQNTGSQSSTAKQASKTTIRDCENVRVVFAENVVGEIIIENSTLLSIIRNGGHTRIPNDVVIRNCTIRDFKATGYWRADFVGNKWVGTQQTSDNLLLNTRVRMYYGNVHTLDAEGHPTHPDGYVNPEFYQVVNTQSE